MPAFLQLYAALADFWIDHDLELVLYGGPLLVSVAVVAWRIRRRPDLYFHRGPRPPHAFVP